MSHTKASEFFWTIENNWRKTTWHINVQTCLHTSLNLVLVLYKKIKKFLCVQYSFLVVCHQTYQCLVLFISYCCECSSSTTHQNLMKSFVKSLYCLIFHTEVGLSCHLFCGFVFQVPNSILYVVVFVLTCLLVKLSRQTALIGFILTSNPHISKSKLGLPELKTLTNKLS